MSCAFLTHLELESEFKITITIIVIVVVVVIILVCIVINILTTDLLCCDRPAESADASSIIPR